MCLLIYLHFCADVARSDVNGHQLCVQPDDADADACVPYGTLYM